MILWCMSSLAAWGLGVSPGISPLDFYPGEKIEGRFTLYNDEETPMTVSIATEGELAPYLQVPQSAALNPSSTKLMGYVLSLPTTLSPGPHTVEIIIAQQPQDIKGKTVIKAIVVVVTQIKVFVPYPDQYPEAGLIINEHPTELEFKMPVKNLGKNEILQAYAAIKITDQLQSIEMLTSDPVSLPSNGQHEFVITWNPKLEPGIYTAEATLHYDGKQIEIKKDFSFKADSLLLVKEVAVDQSTLGGITKFNIDLENKGKINLPDVVIAITLLDEQGKQVASAASPAFSLSPLSTQTIQTYVDTTSVKKGTYKTVIAVRYAGKTIEKTVESVISTDHTEIVSADTTFSGKMSFFAGYKHQSKMFYWVTGAVLMMIFIMVLWFLRRKQSSTINKGQQD